MYSCILYTRGFSSALGLMIGLNPLSVAPANTILLHLSKRSGKFPHIWDFGIWILSGTLDMTMHCARGKLRFKVKGDQDWSKILDAPVSNVSILKTAILEKRPGAWLFEFKDEDGDFCTLKDHKHPLCQSDGFIYAQLIQESNCTSLRQGGADDGKLITNDQLANSALCLFQRVLEMQASGKILQSESISGAVKSTKPLALNYPGLVDAIRKEGAKVVYKLIKTGAIDVIQIAGAFEQNNDGTDPLATWSEFREKVQFYAREKFNELPDLHQFEKFFADTIVDQYYTRFPYWPAAGQTQTAEIRIETAISFVDKLEKYAHLIGRLKVTDKNIDGKLSCDITGEVHIKALTVHGDTMRAQEVAYQIAPIEYIKVIQ